MTAAVWLIAEREIRTYVAAASFWAALAVGPLAVAGALAFSSNHDAAAAVTLHANGAALKASAVSALTEAGRLEGRRFRFAAGGASLVISEPSSGVVDVSFGSGFPLSPEGRRLIARTIERDAARTAAGGSALVVRERAAPEPRRLDADALSRFALVMMLWLTLTGSLGMLLQAVVRERASRSLESLLSVARPWQIMIGKLAGVGVISFVVLAAWLGSAALMSSALPPGTGLPSMVLAYIARPAVLVRAAVMYVLAYAFYGAVTISLGAMARDVATAQNFSRPMFVVLLAAFFISLASVAGPSSTWLAYLPPFTPFLVLLFRDGSLGAATQLVLVVEMILASLAAAWFAAASLSISAGIPNFLRKHRGPPLVWPNGLRARAR
ncbi:MAG TPA: ABC transporter permease [Rhizomicrobium sp.]|nr:ABC transporter permease [Rhizomicrobium sp.]